MALLTNTRSSWKLLAETNALAYCALRKLRRRKKFYETDTNSRGVGDWRCRRSTPTVDSVVKFKTVRGDSCDEISFIVSMKYCLIYS